MEEQWIDNLRKKMDSHQTAVPDGLWEEIESALQQTTPCPARRHRRLQLWTSLLSSAAAIIAIAFLLPYADSTTDNFHTNKETATAPTPCNTNTHQYKFINNLGEQQAQPFVALAASPKQNNLKKLQVTAANAAVASPLTANASESETDKRAADAADFSPTPATDAAERPEEHATPEKQKKAIQHTPSNVARRPHRLPQQQKLKKYKDRLLSLQVYASNQPHQSQLINGYGKLTARNMSPQNMDGALHQMPAIERDLIFSNLGKDIQTHKKHRLPIRLGISLRLPLSPRFSIESGISYTHLSSRLVSGTTDHHFATEQNLDYLGIPIQGNFDIWKNRTWNLYLTAGGTIEKCIHGKATTDYILEQQLQEQTEEKIKEKQLQYSINGAVGAQINFSQRIGVYAEPGIAYYFDNGSRVENIYKEHPLNFNLKLGLRISLK